jgi:hypothetical protein
LHLCDPRCLSLSGSNVGEMRWEESFYLEVHRGRGLAAVLFDNLALTEEKPATFLSNGGLLSADIEVNLLGVWEGG